MIATPSNANRAPALLWSDLAMIATLVGVDVVARLLPHAPNMTPVAASALFATIVLRRRYLALIVPIAAMLLSDVVIGFESWRSMSVIYFSTMLPAVVGLSSAKLRKPVMFVPVMLGCSLTFFVTTNLAVWAFGHGHMYTHDLDGLTKCFIAALPFLGNTVAGDLFWTAVLFGGYWLTQRVPGLLRPHTAA
jgi:hypothetical protein